MFSIPQATSFVAVFKAYQSSDHVTEATGKTIAITISKAGGAFGNPNAGATNATEIANGWYKVTLDTTDTGTLGFLALRGTSSGIDDIGDRFFVEAVPANFASLSIDGSGRVDLGKWDGTAVTLTSGLPDVNVKTIKDGIIAAATFAANALDAVWSATSRLLTAGTNIVLAKGTGITGLNDLDAAGVRGAVGLASANLDTQLDAIPTNSDLATALAGADDATLAAIAALNNVSAADVRTQADAALAAVGLTTTITGRIDADLSSRLAAADYTAPPSAADNGAAVLDVVIADHLGSGSVGDAIYQAATHAINIDSQVGTAGAGLTAVAPSVWAEAVGTPDPNTFGSYAAATFGKVNNLPASPAATGDAMTLTAAYDAAKSAASQTSVDAVASDVTAVKASTDNLPADPADESLVIAATDAIMTRLGAPAGASVSADVAAVAGDTTAIKAKTDELTFSKPGEIDANLQSVNDVTVAGLGTTGSPWGPA